MSYFFVSYKLINRSDTNYHDVYLGSWVDFDLGYPYDDLIGCDSVLGAFYIYNGDTWADAGEGRR